MACVFVAVSAKAEAAAAAERGKVIVFNEGPSNSGGERHVGSVVWRTVRTKVAGQPDQFVIHADIKIPDIKMTATMDLERNTDQRLPASHVVKLKFALPPDIAGGDVIAMPGLLMKFSESARGIPLTAQSAKVTNGSFLIGLSNVEVDRERNLQLLKERAWFDVPMVYANQHRGILAIEKGFHGEDVFHEVMTEWARPR